MCFFLGLGDADMSTLMNIISQGRHGTFDFSVFMLVVVVAPGLSLRFEMFMVFKPCVY